MSGRRYPWSVIVVAVLVPALVLGSGWRSFRSDGGLSKDAAQFERELNRRQPEVIVFGSSLANRGVDLPVLAKSLGIPEQKIVLMQMPHSSLAHWYALLKNRVYANGHEPKLVLVVDALTSMLNHDLLAEMEPNVQRLVGQLSDQEPVIADKVLKMSRPEDFATAWSRLRAEEMRDGVLEGWRDQVITWLFSKRGRLEEGQRLVEKVNESVFADENMNYDLHARNATGVGTTSAGGLIDTSRVPYTTDGDFDLRRDALLPDMAAIAKEHKTNLVYVRIPLPPSNAAMDDVPPEIESDALAWMAELGSGYLDMRALDLDDTNFADMRHLTPQGAQLFTGAVGRVLSAMGAMEPGATAAALRGVGQPSSVRVEGSFPLPDLARATVSADGCQLSVPAGALTALSTDALAARGGLPSPFAARVGDTLRRAAPGEGCVGGAWVADGRLVVARSAAGEVVQAGWSDTVVEAGARPGKEAAATVRWIAPGTTLVYTFDEPWALPDNAFRVFLRGAAVGGGSGALKVSVGEDSATVVPQSGRVSTSPRLLAPKVGPWELRVTVPADGPFVMLHHLAVGVPPTTAYLLGAPETLHGSSIRIVGGRVEDTQHRATYAAQPPPMPFQPRVRRGGRNTGVLQLDKLEDLADSPSRDATRSNKCSPVYVLEDGAPLPQPHSVCYDVVTQQGGRTCFAGDLMLFTSSDGSDPLVNGRSYTLALSPRRLCDVYAQKGAPFLRDSWWLYPKDVAAFALGNDETAVMRDGANLLEIEVIPHVSSLDAPIRVRLYQGDRVVLDEGWVPDGTMRRRRASWPIDPPLPPRAGGIRVEIENGTERSFVLVSSLSLSESFDPQKAAAPVVSAPLGKADDAPPVVGGGRDVVSALRRDGQHLPLGPAKKGGTLPGGAVELRAFPLWPISDSYLIEKLGLPAASPLQLNVDGRALRHVHDKRDFRAGCEDCFYHSGQSLIVHATGASKDSEVALSLIGEPSVQAGDGAALSWIYPGTTLWYDLTTPPKGRAVTVIAELVSMHPQKDLVGVGYFLKVGDQEVLFQRGAGEGAMRASLTLKSAPSGPWAVGIRGEQAGGFAVVRLLRVDDEGGTAWVQRPLQITTPAP